MKKIIVSISLTLLMLLTGIVYAQNKDISSQKKELVSPIKTVFKKDGPRKISKISSITITENPGTKRARVSTVTCTGTCTGDYCSANGCEPWAGGCSSFSCSGESCTSTCTKTVSGGSALK